MRVKKSTPTLGQMLPTRAAQQYARLSERSLHRYAEVGLLHKYYVGGRLRWSVDELDRLVTRGRVA